MSLMLFSDSELTAMQHVLGKYLKALLQMLYGQIAIESTSIVGRGGGGGWAGSRVAIDPPPPPKGSCRVTIQYTCNM